MTHVFIHSYYLGIITLILIIATLLIAIYSIHSIINANRLLRNTTDQEAVNTLETMKRHNIYVLTFISVAMVVSLLILIINFAVPVSGEPFSTEIADSSSLAKLVQK